MDTRGFRTSERGRRSGLGGWVPDGQLGRTDCGKAIKDLGELDS